MKAIEDFNLVENPFQYITANPEISSENTDAWYGLPELKAKINTVYEDLKNFRARQVVLNWGPYGGGKTFSSYYFLNYTSDEFTFHQIYIRSPKKGNVAGNEFYKSIINYISYRKIKRQIKLLLDLFGEDELFEFLHSKIKSEEISEAILLIASDDDETSRTMQRYVYDGLTKTELKQVGLAKNIDWGTDSIKFLAGIFHCFIGDQVRFKGKLVLWIDEMEDMIYYSQKDYRSFSQVLRDLMDSVNEHFCMFMNFTLAESEESTIAVLLGEALWSRITKKIRFKELDIEGAVLYATDAIIKNQVDKENQSNPFSEELLREVLDLIPSESLTPREINRYLGEILKFAQNTDCEEISLNTISEYFNKIAEDE